MSARPLVAAAAAAWVVLAGGALSAQETVELTLAQAEELAVKNNPRLQAATLDATATSEVQAEYRAAYFPTFAATAAGVEAEDGSRLAAVGLTNPAVYDHVGAGVTVSQLVTDFGRTGDLVDAAKLRSDAATQAAAGTRADVLLATGQAYFTVLRAQAVLQVARQTVEERQLVADQVAALAASSLKSALDVSVANVNLADAKLLLVQSENALSGAQTRLAAELGLPGAPRFELADEPLPAPLPDDPDALVRRALGSQPALKGLELDEGAAAKVADAERGLAYPTVGILGTAGVVPSGQPQVPEHFGAIGVNVTLPIFNGGLFRARRREAELRSRAAGKRVDDARLELGRDVRVAFLEEKTARDRMALTEQMLKQAQSSLELAQSRYTLGLSSIVELSQAQLSVTAARIAAADARYDVQSSRLDVDYRTGALK